MRCLALAAHGEQSGDAVRMVVREEAGAVRVLGQAGISTRWLPATCSTSEAAHAFGQELAQAIDRKAPSVWSVIDTYEEPSLYSEAANSARAHVLRIDDTGMEETIADLIVNPNLDAQPSWYPAAADAECLLGGSYAFLRREFVEAMPRATTSGSVRRILVTLGGSDAHNRTELVLKGLQALPKKRRLQLEVDVVLGYGYAHRQSLEALRPALGYRCMLHVGVSNVAELMQRADLAVTAAGGTLYEMAYLGVPMAVVVLASNQEKNAQAFERRGLAVVLGQADTLTPSTVANSLGQLMGDPVARNRMSAKSQTIIDGRGPERIRHAMVAWALRRAARVEVN